MNRLGGGKGGTYRMGREQRQVVGVDEDARPDGGGQDPDAGLGDHGRTEHDVEL